MKIVIDVCLAPSWVQALHRHGIEALHWSQVGDVRAKDSEIAAWARSEGYVVFTNDLDFGAILAFTRAAGPSVIQVRTQDLLPSALEATVSRVLKDQVAALEAGAIITIDELSERIRILPIARSEGEQGDAAADARRRS